MSISTLKRMSNLTQRPDRRSRNFDLDDDFLLGIHQQLSEISRQIQHLQDHKQLERFEIEWVALYLNLLTIKTTIVIQLEQHESISDQNPN
jgi:hypothetical protein